MNAVIIIRIPFIFYVGSDVIKHISYTVNYVLSAHGGATYVQAERGGWADNTYFYKCDVVSAHSKVFQMRDMQI